VCAFHATGRRTPVGPPALMSRAPKAVAVTLLRPSSNFRVNCSCTLRHFLTVITARNREYLMLYSLWCPLRRWIRCGDIGALVISERFNHSRKGKCVRRESLSGFPWNFVMGGLAEMCGHVAVLGGKSGRTFCGKKCHWTLTHWIFIGALFGNRRVVGKMWQINRTHVC